MNSDGPPQQFSSLVVSSFYFPDLLNRIKTYRSLRQAVNDDETKEVETNRGVALVYHHANETHALSSCKKKSTPKRTKKESDDFDKSNSCDAEFTSVEIEGLILRLLEKIESHITELSDFSKWSIDLVSERGEAAKVEMGWIKGVREGKDEESMEEEEEKEQEEDPLMYVDESLGLESRKRQRCQTIIKIQEFKITLPNIDIPKTQTCS